MNKRVKVIPPKQSPKQVKQSGPFHFKGKKFHYIFTLSVIVFCFAIYGNSISNGFSMDDEFVMHDDTVVQKGISAIPQLFRMRYGWDQKGNYGYRPVVTSTYAIEYQLFGNSAHAGHVINILLYACLCIFLFYLFRKLFYNQVSDYFLFVATAIFIAHPLHTEVVDSLKNRDILLVCLFGFYSCYAFVKAFETKNILKQVLWIVSALVCYDLGLMSKPDEILFLAIVPLVLFFYYNGKLKPALLSPVFLYAAMRGLRLFRRDVLTHSHYHRTYIFIEQPLLHTHWFQRISLGFYSLWFYVKKLIFPRQMACYYGYAEVNPFPTWINISVIIGIILTATMLFLIFKNRKNREIILFSLLYLSGTMLIYLDVIEVGPGIVADRFMFIPSVGFVLCTALVLFHLLKLPFNNKPYGVKAQYLYMIAAVIIVIYSVRTIARNPNWKSHLSIYEHDIKSAPRSAKLQSLLAAAYADHIKTDPSLSGDEKVRYYQLAEKAYLASIKIYPKYTTSLNNLGTLEFEYNRDYNKAMTYFAKAVELDSNYADALFNLAATYEIKGKSDQAGYFYLKAIHSNPKYRQAYVNLARIYFSEGKLDQILQFNQQALDEGHVSDVIYVNMGNVYLIKKDTVKAVSYFEKAIAYFNGNEFLADFLAKYFAGEKNEVKANYYARIAEEAKEQNQAKMIRN